MSRSAPLIAQATLLFALLTLPLRFHLAPAIPLPPNCFSYTHKLQLFIMPSAVKPPQTLYDKVFKDHIVEEKEDGTVLLYIGMLLVVVVS